MRRQSPQKFKEYFPPERNKTGPSQEPLSIFRRFKIVDCRPKLVREWAPRCRADLALLAAGAIIGAPPVSPRCSSGFLFVAPFE
jgi:hypothetical protein